MQSRKQSLVQLFLFICAIYSCAVLFGFNSTKAPSAQVAAGQPAARSKVKAMSEGNAMHMSMQMAFEASTAVTLWLKQWHTHSWGSYLLTCLALVGLCLLHELLNAYRTTFHQQYVSAPAAEYDRLQAPGETAGNGSGGKT